MSDSISAPLPSLHLSFDGMMLVMIIDWYPSQTGLRSTPHFTPFTPPGIHYAKITFYFIITNRRVNN